ncbi:MAG: hypothetical protein ACOYKD_06210 [Anaerolineaceae bacterium]|jgi:hypothetical protein
MKRSSSKSDDWINLTGGLQACPHEAELSEQGLIGVPFTNPLFVIANKAWQPGLK